MREQSVLKQCTKPTTQHQQKEAHRDHGQSSLNLLPGRVPLQIDTVVLCQSTRKNIKELHQVAAKTLINCTARNRKKLHKKPQEQSQTDQGPSPWG